jgi:hypothetical protein
MLMATPSFFQLEIISKPMKEYFIEKLERFMIISSIDKLSSFF